MNIETETFVNFNFGEEFLIPIIVIYNKPIDFNDKFVGRLFNIDKATPYIVVKNTLQEVVNSIPTSFVFINRLNFDDPNIEGVFIGGRRSIVC